MDGVLSIREACRMLNCLGFPSKEEQVKGIVQAKRNRLKGLYTQRGTG